MLEKNENYSNIIQIVSWIWSKIKYKYSVLWNFHWTFIFNLDFWGQIDDDNNKLITERLESANSNFQCEKVKTINFLKTSQETVIHETATWHLWNFKLVLLEKNGLFNVMMLGFFQAYYYPQTLDLPEDGKPQLQPSQI